jgi:CspA family cold shock protein
VAGYRGLEAGGVVDFTFEAAEQDGCAFRALEVWPADQAPVRSHDEVSEASPAYHSTLTVTFGTEDETGAS